MSLLPSVAFSLQAAESGESRGQDGSGRRGPPWSGGRAPRPGSTELGKPLMPGSWARLRGLSCPLGQSSLPLVSPTAPLRSPPEEALAYQDLPVRLFVALFDYDPVSMSPNPDAGEEELPFQEGQILKVAASLLGPPSFFCCCLFLPFLGPLHMLLVQPLPQKKTKTRKKKKRGRDK